MKAQERRTRIIEEDITKILSSKRVNWDRFSQGKVLITGITGLIGSYLFDAFATLAIKKESSLQVFGLARDKKRAEKLFSHFLHHNQVNLIIHDITHTLGDLTEFDFIIHAASEASPKYFLADQVGTILANVFGTQQLLELSRRGCSRFLFLSSGTVYGKPQLDGRATAESDFGAYDPLDARACYAESKRMAETLCHAYFLQYSVETLIARISHTYGPGIDLDDGRVFGDFIRDAVAGREIRVQGGGYDSRPFLYITDAIEAIFILLERGAPGNAYNLGAETEVTIHDLAKLIARLSGQRVSVARSDEIDHNPSSASRTSGHFSLEKIKRLGWHPTIDIEMGFKRTLAHFDIGSFGNNFK